MLPNFKPGDSVIVSPIPYVFGNPQIGDVAMLIHPIKKIPIIKRISAEQNGQYFVVGDNPKESTDSRQFGMIGKSDIVGKVILVL